MSLVKHLSSEQIMRNVIYALIPLFLVNIYLYGVIAILQILIAITTAIIVDFSIAKMRKLKPSELIFDYSSILTALLLVFSIPTIAPFWIIIIGVIFALVFAKYIYGGLGNNIFNPAMVGYAFLLISYPLEMSLWQIPMLDISFTQLLSNIDSISGATALDIAKNNLPTQQSNTTLYSAIAIIIGGVYLLFKKIISWHIPLSIIIFSMVVLFLINIFTGSEHPILFHLISGGFIFAIFFIATDPVTTSSSNLGKLIFGCMVGFLIIIIRIFGNYPDGIAFAILITNMFVPLIDYYIRSGSLRKV